MSLRSLPAAFAFLTALLFFVTEANAETRVLIVVGPKLGLGTGASVEPLSLR